MACAYTPPAKLEKLAKFLPGDAGQSLSWAAMRRPFGVRLRNEARVELPLSSVSWSSEHTGLRQFTGCRLRQLRGLRAPSCTPKAVAALILRCATAVQIPPASAHGTFGVRPRNEARVELPLSSVSWPPELTGLRQFTGSSLRKLRGLRARIPPTESGSCAHSSLRDRTPYPAASPHSALSPLFGSRTTRSTACFVMMFPWDSRPLMAMELKGNLIERLRR